MEEFWHLIGPRLYLEVCKLAILSIVYRIKFRYGRSYFKIPINYRVRMKFSKQFGIRTRSPSVRSAVKSLVIGKFGVPMTMKSSWCLGPFRDEPGYLLLDSYKYLNCRYDELVANCKNIDGVVYSTLSRVDINYFHWIVESCTQILSIRDYMQENAGALSVIYRLDGPSFIVHSLQLMLDGLPYKLVPADVDNYSCEMLLTAVFPSYIMTIDRTNLYRIRDLLSARIEDAQSAHERIYVKRCVGGWRYVLNDEAMDTALEELGFCTIHCEQLTLEEQIQTFRSAKIIVGMHGAGLTNLMFASEPVLIELRGDYGGNDYERLCAAMNSRHILFSCTDVDQNIIVDSARLMALIRNIIESPSA